MRQCIEQWRGWGLNMAMALQMGIEVSGLSHDRVDFAGIEKGVDQIVLQESECNKTHNPLPETEGFMGWGGALTLVNGSPFDWRVSSVSSYQMPAWNWPTVQAGIWHCRSQEQTGTHKL